MIKKPPQKPVFILQTRPLYWSDQIIKQPRIIHCSLFRMSFSNWEKTAWPSKTRDNRRLKMNHQRTLRAQKRTETTGLWDGDATTTRLCSKMLQVQLLWVRRAELGAGDEAEKSRMETEVDDDATENVTAAFDTDVWIIGQPTACKRTASSRHRTGGTGHLHRCF